MKQRSGVSNSNGATSAGVSPSGPVPGPSIRPVQPGPSGPSGVPSVSSSPSSLTSLGSSTDATKILSTGSTPSIIPAAGGGSGNGKLIFKNGNGSVNSTHDNTDMKAPLSSSSSFHILNEAIPGSANLTGYWRLQKASSDSTNHICHIPGAPWSCLLKTHARHGSSSSAEYLCIQQKNGQVESASSSIEQIAITFQSPSSDRFIGLVDTSAFCLLMRKR
jgi:hypothetical protein